MSRYAYEPERTPMEVGLARERERSLQPECCECGGAIQGGETFYQFGDAVYCKKCLLRYHTEVAPYPDEF